MDSVTAKYIKSFSVENGICVLEFEDRIILDIEAIHIVDRYCDGFTAGKRLKKLIIAGRNTQITKEARVFGQEKSKAMKDFIIAEAIVVHTLPQKMTANFYFRFLKNLYPMKFFTDVDKARQWLDEQQEG